MYHSLNKRGRSQSSGTLIGAKIVQHRRGIPQRPDEPLQFRASASASARRGSVDVAASAPNHKIGKNNYLVPGIHRLPLREPSTAIDALEGRRGSCGASCGTRNESVQLHKASTGPSRDDIP